MDSIRDFIEGQGRRFIDLSERIWRTPEIALREFESSRVLMDALEAAGFSVRRGGDAHRVRREPWRRFAGDRPARRVRRPAGSQPGRRGGRAPADLPGGPGHGCGHNLLGTAAVAAALAIQSDMDRGGLRGTIRVYGCPAEETLVGEVFMVREGLFSDVDCALTWHPGSINTVWAASSQAMNSLRVRFEGTAAHAVANPEDGRSALDAVELMNVGMLQRAVRHARRSGMAVPDGCDLVEAVAPSFGYGETESCSTDVGDVSKVVPTAQINTVTAPLGTPGHSWQNVVAAGSAIGQRGMLFAAEVLAEAARELLLGQTWSPGRGGSSGRPPRSTCRPCGTCRCLRSTETPVVRPAPPAARGRKPRVRP